MQSIGSSNSEFGLYESIIYGELRPFLPEYSSNEYFESLAETQDEDSEDQALIEEIDILFDDDEEEGLEKEECKIISETENSDSEIHQHLEISLCLDLGDGKSLEPDELNIPQPPDKKAEYFLSLIENEFDEIKKRAKEFLYDGQREKDIAQFANQNIQKAKKIAIDSGHLSKHLKTEDFDSSADSDAYIMSALGQFLIQSVLFYQNLFEQYLKNPPESEDELQAYVKNPYVFSYKGDYWKINFNGKETLIKDLERIRYIIYLLETPNKEFYCHDLAALVKGLRGETNKDYSKMAAKRLEQENLSLVDLTIEQLSDDEKETLENMAYDAWGKVKHSPISSHLKKKAQKDWESVKTHLFNEYGIKVARSDKGLSFSLKARLTRDLEKARSNVTKQIKSAIKSIGQQIPPLSEHLKNAIDTGAKCCYRPDPNNPIEWTILWNN